MITTTYINNNNKQKTTTTTTTSTTTKNSSSMEYMTMGTCVENDISTSSVSEQKQRRQTGPFEGETKTCSNWQRKGRCNKGDQCRYRHEGEILLKQNRKETKKETKKTGVKKYKKNQRH